MYLPSQQEVRNLTLQDDFHFLIKLPANPTLSFLSILEVICSDSKLRPLPYYSDFSDIPRERLGVFISHPALRLWDAYNAHRSTIDQKISFQEYYSQPVRLNFYTKYFKDNDLLNLGYVGFGQHPIKSLIIAHDWLKLSKGRVPYYKLDLFFNKKNDCEQCSIHQEDLDKIKVLHAQDFVLYENLMKSFQLKWSELVVQNKINLPIDKKLFIHLGPPKTGTSAIQYWLKSNSTKLLKESVFYPEHSLDSNRISSGNVDQIISIEGDSENSYLDIDKVTRLITKFEESNCELMLLSSEHFYYYLIWLFTAFPDATFIFYVRHPLAALQSGYNQEVKRHKRTSCFNIPKSIKFYNLYLLYKVSSEFDINFEIRLFDKQLFVNNSLISDFLSCLPKPIVPDAQVNDVNIQYCYEAMEFMRTVNNFASADTLNDLDIFLQHYSIDKPKFSLISSEQAKAYNKKLLEDSFELADFFSISREKIRILIENFTVTDEMFYSQDKEVEFNGIIKALKKHNLELLERLAQELKKGELESSNLGLGSFAVSRIERFLYKLKKLT